MEWQTCCKGRSGCPKVAVEHHEVVHISDDYGVETEMVLAEFDKQASTQRGNQDVVLTGMDGKVVKMAGDQLEVMVSIVDKDR